MSAKVEPVFESWGLEDLAICTAVKDRLPHLVKSMPTWLETNAKEVVVMDWASKRPITYAQLPKDDRIRIYRKDDEKHFVPAIAMNCAVKLTTAEVVAKLDCDVMLVKPLPEGRPEGASFWRGDDTIDSPTRSPKTFGSWLMPRRYFDAVGGYCELLRGRSSEDDNLYARLRKIGCLPEWFPGGTLFHQDHDYSVRVKEDRNMKYVWSECRQWNRHRDSFDVRTLILVER